MVLPSKPRIWHSGFSVIESLVKKGFRLHGKPNGSSHTHREIYIYIYMYIYDICVYIYFCVYVCV